MTEYGIGAYYTLSVIDGIERLNRHREEIVDSVYEKIQECEIWIPYYEVKQYFNSRLSKWNQKYAEEKQETESENERRAGI